MCARELDRLVTHVAAARAMLGEGGAIGRRLDFLAQEFNAKPIRSAPRPMTFADGYRLELKGVVEQFREQFRTSSEGQGERHQRECRDPRRRHWRAAGADAYPFLPLRAGKSTLARLLLEQNPDIYLSVSVTTRGRRPSEVEGVHYHFLTRERFERLRDAGDLLEWAEVHGNFYGTPREPVEAALSAGRDVLFDIDYQGAEQLYEKMRQDIVGVFILPPSAAELKTRLERAREDASV